MGYSGGLQEFVVAVCVTRVFGNEKVEEESMVRQLENEIRLKENEQQILISN